MSLAASFLQCKVNPKYISDSSPVPYGMMATTKMKFAAYHQLMHDPLMADPVEPTSSQAWFIRDGIRLVYKPSFGVALSIAVLHCALSDLALEWRRGWGCLCFDAHLCVFHVLMQTS